MTRLITQLQTMKDQLIYQQPQAPNAALEQLDKEMAKIVQTLALYEEAKRKTSSVVKLGEDDHKGLIFGLSTLNQKIVERAMQPPQSAKATED